MPHIMKTKPGVVCEGRIIQDPVTMRRSCERCRESIINEAGQPRSNPHFEATPESLNRLLAQKSQERQIKAQKEQLLKEGKKDEAEKLGEVQFDPSGKAGFNEGLVASPAGVAALMRKPPETTPAFIGQTAEPVGDSKDSFVTPQAAVAAQIAGNTKIAEAQENAPQAPLLGMLEKAAQAGGEKPSPKKR